jgi:GNAT superfamily N-acetyltransferase
MTLRLARPDEREALIALQRQASLMWEEDRDALLAEPDAIDLPADQIAEGHVFVWEEGGAVLGFAVVLPRDDGAAELDGLFTAPDAWGRGIGRKLVDHAVEAARAQGCVSLNVVANKRALGFYLKCGFQALGEAPTRFSPGIRMVRPL